MYGAIGFRLIKSTGWDRPSRQHPRITRLTGLNESGFAGEYVSCVHDYSLATRSGKGSYAFYFLSPGLYEFFYPISWKHDERYFARVDENGDIHHKIPKDEVIRCLKNATSE